jgi:DNA-binding transcriptional LysR family regulator
MTQKSSPAARLRRVSQKGANVDLVQNMRIFVRVVETGSFTAIATETDVTAAQISRAVTGLEEHLQTALLHRSTRHLSLTDAGARFYERAKSILAEIDSATDEVRNATERPQGRIRVHAAPGLADSYVTKALVSYQAANPDVFVELEIAQTMPDLVEEGYDISLVSATQLPDSMYVAQGLGSAYLVLVASADYLKTHGTPRTPADLADHSLLRLDSPVARPDEWRLEGPEGESLIAIRKSAFQVNSPATLRSAIQWGAGIGALATYSVLDDLRRGKLVRVLPQYRLQPFTVFALYASRRYLDAKIRTLLEHLRADVSPALASTADAIQELADAADISQRQPLAEP